MDSLTIDYAYRTDATALIEKFQNDYLQCEQDPTTLAHDLFRKISELKRNRDWAFKVVGYTPPLSNLPEIDFNLNFEEPTT